MLHHRLSDFITTSPVVLASMLISLACAAVLAINISSKLEQSDATHINSEALPVYKHQGEGQYQKTSTSSFASGVSSRSDASGDNSNRTNVPSDMALSTQATRAALNPLGSRQQTPTTQTHDFAATAMVAPVIANNRQPDDSPAIFNNDFSYNSKSRNFLTTAIGTQANSGTTLPDAGGATSSAENTTTDFTGENDTTATSISDNAGDTEPFLPESEFPVALENTVKTDIDESQHISCRPVVANGLPCMCTLTMTDANGSISEVVDNCS